MSKNGLKLQVKRIKLESLGYKVVPREHDKDHSKYDYKNVSFDLYYKEK